MADDSDVIDTQGAVNDAVAAATARLGLQQPRQTASASGAGVRNKRKAAPTRDGPIWKSVKIVREHDTTPQVECTYCGHTFCGGATRIEEHLINKCTCESNAFLEMKEKLMQKKEVKDEKKAHKTAVEEVNTASEGKVEVKVKPEPKMFGGQQNIMASLNAATKMEVDDALAEMFYALNITPNVADSPWFKKAVAKLKKAPASYVPPNANRFRYDLLDSTTARLKAEEAPTREAVLKDGGTVCSDGWDDVERNHLINFLIGNSKGMFFDGTIKLTSSDSEDATHVAKLICDAIETQGALSIVQVVTDTCSVMKSAWKIVEEKFPWITCTCCGPHVLSLELKDLAKIKEVADVIGKTGKVLNRFWGRTRWCRTRLREVAHKNHGKRIGLYRAKATRFAGKVREMGRVLRLKADLQEVVISADYSKQKWPKKKKDAEAEDDEEELDGEGGVKAILLDESGFWKPLVEALRARASPLTALDFIPHRQ
jgi:predicted  nucleic acid-binding Zn-ribbon protein